MQSALKLPGLVTFTLASKVEVKMKIIVLDRDGVINQDSDAYIKHANEWHPEPGAIEAIVKLKQAGWLVAIATNQSGLSRGYYNHATLSGMHQKLQALLVAEGGEQAKVDWISFSPYQQAHNAPCRKPGNGLLRAISNRFNVSLQGMPMVGDTLNDVAAAKSMGMQPLMVRTGKGAGLLAKHALADEVLQGVTVYHNLLEAVTQGVLLAEEGA